VAALDRSQRLALIRDALAQALGRLRDDEGDEILWTWEESSDVEEELRKAGFSIVAITRHMADGSPCWCVSTDAIHDGWQHSPTCDLIRAAAGVA
jgi:hypothetical protein